MAFYTQNKSEIFSKIESIIQCNEGFLETSQALMGIAASTLYKRIVLLGGPPGSGKTTLLNRMRKTNKRAFLPLDPDDFRDLENPIISQFLNSVGVVNLEEKLSPNVNIISGQLNQNFNNRLHAGLVSISLLSAQDVIYSRPWSNQEGLVNVLNIFEQYNRKVDLVMLLPDMGINKARLQRRIDKGGFGNLSNFESYWENCRSVASFAEKSDHPALNRVFVDRDTVRDYSAQSKLQEFLSK